MPVHIHLRTHLKQSKIKCITTYMQRTKETLHLSSNMTPAVLQLFFLHRIYTSHDIHAHHMHAPLPGHPSQTRAQASGKQPSFVFFQSLWSFILGNRHPWHHPQGYPSLASGTSLPTVFSGGHPCGPAPTHGHRLRLGLISLSVGVDAMSSLVAMTLKWDESCKALNTW